MVDIGDKPEIIRPYPAEPEGHLDVPQGTWGMTNRITGGPPLSTREVASCAVIAITNTDVGRGYLGHFLRPGFKDHGNKAEFDAMIAAVKENEDPTHALEVWVSGTSLFGDSGKSKQHNIHDEDTWTDRGHIIDSLGSLGKGTIVTIEWLGEMQVLPVVTFDPLGPATIRYVTDSSYDLDEDAAHLSSLGALKDFSEGQATPEGGNHA